MENYKIMMKVGEGTFGEVFKARHITSGRIVALKKIRIRRLDEGIPKTLLREIKALEQIHHCHVVSLYEFFPHGSSVVIAFEYMETDLNRIMRGMSRACRTFATAEIKSIMLMLIKGVAAVHESRLIHRDLKPANILFSPHGDLKLGDFGLARVHQDTGDANYSHEVATRWYRAPELLFGARNYGSAVDMWAVGCIFAELLLHAPLFPGENDIDQLYRVLRVLGTPTPETWPEAQLLPDFHKISFPNMAAMPLKELLPDADPLALDLLGKLLVFPPSARVSARKALSHAYFFSAPFAVQPWRLRNAVRLPWALKDAKAGRPSFDVKAGVALECQW